MTHLIKTTTRTLPSIPTKRPIPMIMNRANTVPHIRHTAQITPHIKQIPARNIYRTRLSHELQVSAAEILFPFCDAGIEAFEGAAADDVEEAVAVELGGFDEVDAVEEGVVDVVAALAGRGAEVVEFAGGGVDVEVGES